MKMKYTIVIVSLFVLIALTISIAEEESKYEFGQCEICHTEIAENFTTSLHYTGRGMMCEYNEGAAGAFGINMNVLYADKNCAKCHATTCSDCHGPEPHVNDLSQNIETCDVCHLKKQASFIGDMPMHKSQGPSMDIHYEKGFVCVDCHTADEAHGDGTEYTNMLSAVKVTCEDCHSDPEKEVKGMSVTQYSTDIASHEIHEETLDCSACHIAWIVTCVNCHLDTMKTEGITTENFYLAKAADGKIKPFMEMVAVYENETHTAYVEYYSHTITNKPHDCAFCHENKEVLCDDKDGQMLGPAGASFISSETIDRIYGVTTVPTPDQTAVPTSTQEQPGFGAVVAIGGLLATVYLLHKRD